MVIAWAYIVAIEEGVTKTQLFQLVEEIPTDTDVVPFSNGSTLIDSHSSFLEANSILYGFVDNDYRHVLPEIKETVVRLFSFDKKHEDAVYTLRSGYQVKVWCESISLHPPFS